MFKKRRMYYDIDLKEIVKKASKKFPNSESRFSLEEPGINILCSAEETGHLYYDDRTETQRIEEIVNGVIADSKRRDIANEYYEEVSAIEEVLRDEDYPIPDQSISFNLTDWMKGNTIRMCEDEIKLRKKIRKSELRNRHSLVENKSEEIQKRLDESWRSLNKTRNRRAIAEWIWDSYGIAWRCKDYQMYYIKPYSSVSPHVGPPSIYKYSLEEFLRIQSAYDYNRIDKLELAWTKLRKLEYISAILFVCFFIFCPVSYLLRHIASVVGVSVVVFLSVILSILIILWITKFEELSKSFPT